MYPPRVFQSSVSLSPGYHSAALPPLSLFANCRFPNGKKLTICKFYVTKQIKKWINRVYKTAALLFELAPVCCTGRPWISACSRTPPSVVSGQELWIRPPEQSHPAHGSLSSSLASPAEAVSDTQHTHYTAKHRDSKGRTLNHKSLHCSLHYSSTDTLLEGRFTAHLKISRNLQYIRVSQVTTTINKWMVILG